MRFLSLALHVLLLDLPEVPVHIKKKKTYYRLHIIYFNMMDYVITLLVEKGSDNNWNL